MNEAEPGVSVTHSTRCASVSDAVAFAHTDLAVQRDLKPSNILVTEDGEPKSSNFGISELLIARAMRAA